MKLRKRESFIDLDVRFGLLQRQSAMMLQKGGKILASLEMRVGRMFLSSLIFASSLWQKNAPARHCLL